MDDRGESGVELRGKRGREFGKLDSYRWALRRRSCLTSAQLRSDSRGCSQDECNGKEI